MKYTENDVFVLRDEEIKAATEMEYRQYFSGNLKRPQLLKESDKVVVTPSPEVKQWMGEEI